MMMGTNGSSSLNAGRKSRPSSPSDRTWSRISRSGGLAGIRASSRVPLVTRVSLYLARASSYISYLLSSSSMIRMVGWFISGFIRLSHGQDEGESAVLVHHGLHSQAGFHLLSQLIDHREAQAGAAPDGEGFGGEKGLEDAGQVFGRYAGAEIPDGDGGITRGGHGRQHQARRQLIHLAHGQDYLLPVGLGFRGVEDEVQQDLLNEVLGAGHFGDRK